MFRNKLTVGKSWEIPVVFSSETLSFRFLSRNVKVKMRSALLALCFT
jgi:hypothetical protein